MKRAHGRFEFSQTFALILGWLCLTTEVNGFGIENAASAPDTKTPPTSIDLQTENVLVEMTRLDELPAGICCVQDPKEIDAQLALNVRNALQEHAGSCRRFVEPAMVKQIYQMKSEDLTGRGDNYVVVRLDGQIRHRQAFRCLSYKRTGNKIEVEIGQRLFGGGPVSAYVLAKLPTLPPGAYDVTVKFTSCDIVAGPAGEPQWRRYVGQNSTAKAQTTSFMVKAASEEIIR